MQKSLGAAPVLGIFLALMGCSTYRLQYQETFVPTHEAKPYRFYYEETFAKPQWFPWACGFTAIYYGGACWFYLSSHEDDVQDIREQGSNKLLEILNKKPIESQNTRVVNLRTSNRRLPSRLGLFDSEGRAIVMGDADSIHAIPDSKWSSQEEGPIYLKKSPSSILADYDTKFSYASIQVGLHSGRASVSSHVTENGLRSKVAAGEVPYQMLEIRSGTLARNGWFWSWAPNLTSQTLKIADFSSRLPLFQSSDGYDIPVVVSNPNDQSIITDYVNSYTVGLNTAGVLLGAGYSRHWKYKDETDFWSFSAAGNFSALDYMQTKVKFSSRTLEKNFFASLQSYGFKLDAYYNILSWHVALGFHGGYRIFPSVQMPDHMEFRGPARFDADQQVFVRPQLSIDRLTFASQTIGFSLSYIFEEFRFNE